MVYDLGKTWNTLHQTTISGDGRYLMVVAGIGGNINFPDYTIFTIDLVKKTAVQTKVQNSYDIVPLAAMAC